MPQPSARMETGAQGNTDKGVRSGVTQNMLYCTIVCNARGLSWSARSWSKHAGTSAATGVQSSCSDATLTTSDPTFNAKTSPESQGDRAPPPLMQES